MHLEEETWGRNEALWLRAYGQCSRCMGKGGGEKKHEVSVLRHQGNERYVELMPVQHSGSCVTS